MKEAGGEEGSEAPGCQALFGSAHQSPACPWGYNRAPGCPRRKAEEQQQPEGTQGGIQESARMPRRKAEEEQQQQDAPGGKRRSMPQREPQRVTRELAAAP